MEAQQGQIQAINQSILVSESESGAYVLGCLVIYKQSMGIVIDLNLKPKHFLPAQKQLAEVIWDLYDSGKPIDLLSASKHCKTMGKPIEAFEISDLTYKVGGNSNLAYHARIVQQDFLRRILSGAMAQFESLPEKQSIDPFEAIEKVQDWLSNAVSEITMGGNSSMSEHVDQFKSDLYATKTGTNGIKTGIAPLDNFLVSKPGHVVVLAGRPGMGKTAVGIQITLNGTVNNAPSGWISLEMTGPELIGRMAGNMARVSMEDVDKGMASADKLELIDQYAEKIRSMPIEIHDKGIRSRSDIRPIVSQMVRKIGIKNLFIDYLQLIPYGEKDATIALEKTTAMLKGIAKEFGIVIYEISQLSRDVEKRSPPVPQLSDLRRSGSIEQDADKVIFPYRPNYYGLETWNDHDGEVSTDGLLLFLVMKNRGGAVGSVRAGYELPTQRIGEYFEPMDFESEYIKPVF